MQKSFNAGLILATLRTVGGAFFLASLWGLWGGAVAGVSLALAMVLWCLVWGPLFFWVLLAFRHPFVGKSVFVLDLKKYPVLLKAFFKGILREPGPNPELFVIPSRDISLTWLQVPLKNRQKIFVTSAWLEQGYHDLVHQFGQTWSEIASLSRGARTLRTAQWCLWCSCLLPLDLSLHLLDVFFSFFGFHKLPRAGFWAQRTCWHLRRLWFGGMASDSDQIVFEMASRSRGVFEVPAAFESLLWGVWSRHAQHGMHPSWAILMDADAFFPSTASSRPS